MSKQIPQHIKKMNYRSNPEDNRVILETVGKNLKNDPDTEISALGSLVVAAGTELGSAVVGNKDAHDAALLATKVMNDSNADGSKTYNDAAAKIELKFPGDTEKWMSYGYEVTKDIASDRPIPDKPQNCVMSQGAFPRTCTITFDVPANAENYTVEITRNDPKEDAGYVVVRSPKIIYTTTTITFDVTGEYLNVPLWAKVTAHNAAGQSPASDPFGGLRIQ
jgi:hypothetical protein